MATYRKRGKSFQLRCSMGYDANGKQIVHSKTWTPPVNWTDKKAEKEAQHQAEIFEEEVRNGLLPNGNIKFHDFSEKWFENYAEPNLKPRTVDWYRGLSKRTDQAIGHLPLNAIQPIHLLNFYKQLGDIDSNGLSFYSTADIKGQIKDKGLTKAEFAKEVNISKSTLTTVFNHGTVSRATAEKIAAGLEQPLLSLFQTNEKDVRLSTSSIRQYHCFISSVLETAVKWQYIPYNPCNRCLGLSLNCLNGSVLIFRTRRCRIFWLFLRVSLKKLLASTQQKKFQIISGNYPLMIT